MKCWRGCVRGQDPDAEAKRLTRRGEAHGYHVVLNQKQLTP